MTLCKSSAKEERKGKEIWNRGKRRMGLGKALDGVGTRKLGWGDKQNALDGGRVLDGAGEGY